jgi:hypothetical protein
MKIGRKGKPSFTTQKHPSMIASNSPATPSPKYRNQAGFAHASPSEAAVV